MLFVDEVRIRVSIVALDERGCLETIQQAAKQGMSSGRIYDALHLRCAEKANADRTYTWNQKHFRAIAPHLPDRIRTP